MKIILEIIKLKMISETKFVVTKNICSEKDEVYKNNSINRFFKI